MEKLSKKNHVLDGAELKIEPFYSFLGQEVCTKKIDIHPEIMAYIKTHYEKELQAVLDDNALQLQWQPNEAFALITPRNSAVRDEIASARGNRVEKVEEFLKDFEHKTFTMECSLFDEVADSLQKYLEEKDTRKFDLSWDASLYTVSIVGKRDTTEEMAKKIGDFIERVTEEKRIKESVVVHTECDLNSGQLAVLKKSGLADYLQDSYKYTRIDIDDGNGNVFIHCPESKIQEVITKVLRFVAKVDKEVVKLSERILEVFLTPKGAKCLSNAFKNENLVALLMIDDEQKTKNEATVYAQNSDQRRKAVELIYSFAKEKSIRLQDESVKVVKGSKWKELIDNQQDEFVVHVLQDKIHRETLWISGIEQDVIKCYENVKQHIDKYTILHDCVDVSQGNLKFLFKVWEDKIKKISEELKESFVKIKPNYKEMKIEISGNQHGIKIGKARLLSNLEKIRSEEVKVDKPGMAKFFKSNQGSKELKSVERDHNCLIEVVEGKSHLVSQEVFIPSEDLDVVCSQTIPEGKTLSVCKDDLTKHPVDVIVNASNAQLKHTGGLAGAIVRVGGQQIQDECDKYIRENGDLQTGEVIDTDSGTLPCQRIIHAVGPRWGRTAKQQHAKGQKTKEEELLHKAIQESLLIAKDYESIAIPAISSGIFGFPVDLCARTVIQSTIDFFELHPHCKLSDVRFTNNDDSTVEAFQTEMNRVFGGDDDTESKDFAEASAPSPVFGNSAFLTPEGVSISVKVGNIAKEHVSKVKTATKISSL